jgi:GNAT superfamily N-acetyltransferase
MFRTMRAFWLANAERSRGGSTLELPGVAAATVPAMPERSVVNSVVYEDAVGVDAWTVWVHESDARAQDLLAAAGNALDAEPMGQARGHGLASLLLRKALADARDRGCTITTLQATRMGYPVCARLGYRDLGRVQMWERRGRAPGA